MIAGDVLLNMRTVISSHQVIARHEPNGTRLYYIARVYAEKPPTTYGPFDPNENSKHELTSLIWSDVRLVQQMLGATAERKVA